MARGVKTDNKTKAKIRASYALTNSYNATAKELKISDSTVKGVIEENPEEFRKVQEQKKETFAEQAQSIIDKAMLLLQRRYDKALEKEKELEQMMEDISKTSKDDIDYQTKLAAIKKLSKIELNNLAEITTSMGTIYDKMRLDKGESTGNIKVSYEESLKAVSDDNDY